MPYFVLVGGAVAVVFIWLNVIKKGDDSENGLRIGFSVIGTGVVLWAMWTWGVQAIQEQNEQAIREELWLSTFVQEHQREWDEDCLAILTSFGAQGVIYDNVDGTAYTLDYCRAMWSPPEQPTEYSASQYDQPGRVPPFPSEVLFDPDTPGWLRCVDPQLSDCYEWIDFRGGPG